MIPILYESTETSFTSNGLGGLPDAITCTVTEERNGEYELEMLYPVSGLHYEDLTRGRIITAKGSPSGTAQGFEIYKISKVIGGRVTVYARHISYRLSYIPVTATSAFTTAQTALNGLQEAALEDCPFEFWSDNATTGTFQVEEPTSIRSILGGVTGSILDVFGGEYEWDNWTVKLHAARGTDRGVRLEYGKNITDITQEESIESTSTGILPYWSDSEGTVVVGEIVECDNAAAYAYKRTAVHDFSGDFEDEPTEDDLTSAAETYVSNNIDGEPTISIDVSFAALAGTEEYKNISALERVDLCDTLTVHYTPLDIDVTAKVVTTVYNVLKDRYDSLEVGSSKTNLSDTIADSSTEIAEAVAEQTTWFTKAITKATELLRGGLGGYVVINTAADGHPQEILIMDTDDIDTAVNVIRMNKAGIGFSTNGYNGTFNSAWTIDGTFDAEQINVINLNASSINTGTLDASLITVENLSANSIVAGTLSDSAGLFSLNMDTGEVVMANGTFTNGTFTGKVTATSGSFTGAVYASSGSFTGAVYASSGSFTGAVTATSGSFTGTIYATDGEFTGKVTATSGKIQSGCQIGQFTVGDCLYYNKTGMDAGAGRGIYIGMDGLSVGEAYNWSGKPPVFKVDLSSDYTYVECTGLKISREDAESAGYMSRYSSSSKGWTLNTDLYLEGSLTESSDARLKRDIERISLEESRELIMSLTPRSYRYREDPTYQHHGFVAQEASAEFDLVRTGDDGYLSLAYTDLIADLVNVVQDQEKRIEELERRLNGNG